MAPLLGTSLPPARFHKIRGRPYKAALVAVMRKLILLVNTLLRKDRLYQPGCPSQRPLAPTRYRQVTVLNGVEAVGENSANVVR